MDAGGDAQRPHTTVGEPTAAPPAGAPGAIATVGIIGVGEIGEAITEGLCASAAPPTVHLSPRSATIARGLADRYPDVHVAADNQGVVDRSQAVVLAIPPAALEAVSSEIDIPADRIVISAVAGCARSDLLRLLPHRPEVVRVIPLPAVRANRGVTAVFPGDAAVEELFSRVGEVIVAPGEDGFSALSAATATISSHLHYLATIGDWLAARGWAPDDADGFVRGMFAGVASGLADGGRALPELARAHETPDGINESLRRQWFTPDNRHGLERALTRILDRVSPAGPGDAER